MRLKLFAKRLLGLLRGTQKGCYIHPVRDTKLLPLSKDKSARYEENTDDFSASKEGAMAEKIHLSAWVLRFTDKLLIGNEIGGFYSAT